MSTRLHVLQHGQCREASILPGVGLLVVAAIHAPGAAFAQPPAAPPAAASDSTLELAKKTQNPIADLISLPLQNDLNFGYGAKAAPSRWCRSR
jgi:hypothetical protein